MRIPPLVHVLDVLVLCAMLTLLILSSRSGCTRRHRAFATFAVSVSLVCVLFGDAANNLEVGWVVGSFFVFSSYLRCVAGKPGSSGK